MTVTIKVRPETQVELARQAAQSGRVLDDYLSELLEAVVQQPIPSPLAPDDDPDFGKKLIAVCAMVRGLTDDVDFSRDKSSTWRPLDIS